MDLLEADLVCLILFLREGCIEPVFVKKEKKDGAKYRSSPAEIQLCSALARMTVYAFFKKTGLGLVRDFSL